MSFLIQNEISNEFLTEEEVEELTGASQLNVQLNWLKEKEWEYSVNHKNKVKIGRWYARIKMSGISTKAVEIGSMKLPNFDKVS